jgi:hypothetical protein
MGSIAPEDPPMRRDGLDMLIGLRLSIVRRAADMLGLHFGDIRPHPSGEGTVGAYTLHVQCPWRLDRPNGTITGSGDLWVYAGRGERPPNWSYDDGFSLQDRKFAQLRLGKHQVTIAAAREQAPGLRSGFRRKRREGTRGSIFPEFAAGKIMGSPEILMLFWQVLLHDQRAVAQPKARVLRPCRTCCPT